jgi:uncharacterized membrane protein YkvA (DUF1232 family)
VSTSRWLLLLAVCALVLYGAFIVAILIAGRRQLARDLMRFIPDCVVLVKRLLGDPRVPRRRKLLLGLLVGYLALPFDLVPDFIPVAGQLDDAVVIALALRALLRGSGTALVREHWPGPESSLAAVLHLVGASGGALKPGRDLHAGRVAPPVPATEEVAMSESTQDRPDEADEQAPKPGEQDTETVAGQPRKAPESTDGEQSKQDQ